MREGVVFQDGIELTKLIGSWLRMRSTTFDNSSMFVVLTGHYSNLAELEKLYKYVADLQ